MNAVIRVNVPDFQIGQDVSVYFPDTMMKRGVCEADGSVKPKKRIGYYDCSTPQVVYGCGKCNGGIMPGWKYCPHCGRQILWKEK